MITKPKIYTEKFVKDEVTKILNLVLKNKDIVYIGEVFENLTYPRQNWSEWKKTFKDIKEISDTIERVNEILETRINVGGLKNKFNSTMTKFNLINNYDWKDKNETDITSQGDKLGVIVLPQKNVNPLEADNKTGRSSS